MGYEELQVRWMYSKLPETKAEVLKPLLPPESIYRLSGPALGRPKKELPDRKQNYIDECERVEVERRFSLAKRKCNLGMVTAKLTDTAFHCIAMSVVVLNLRKLMLSLPDFLKQHFLYFGFFGLSFIQ